MVLRRKDSNHREASMVMSGAAVILPCSPGIELEQTAGRHRIAPRGI